MSEEAWATLGLGFAAALLVVIFTMVVFHDGYSLGRESCIEVEGR